jgi:ABC-type dipeptide/oligopeptide/nickel transport system ATPase component
VRPRQRFETIAGAVEGLAERKESRCGFAGRCPERFDPCEKSVPSLFPSGGAQVRCFLYEGAGTAG